LPEEKIKDNSSIFDGLIGQEHAVRVLGNILRTGLPSHAYLFHGSGGSGKLEAAQRFAAALTCAESGCGHCEDCAKALRGTHPDIVTVEPVGAFITVDQVREINRSINLHPSEGQARVFIVSPAEAFNAESANAFLKTLEEPPPFVYFLLLASSIDRVLPTIVSRCQMVRFSPVGATEIETYLQGRGEISKTMAQAFARVSRGNLALAEALQDDLALATRRQRYIEAGESITRGGPDAVPPRLAAALLAVVESAIEGDGSETEPPEGFEIGTRKQRDQNAHRREAAGRRNELALALDFIETWFRDLMVTAAGAVDAVLNKDYELELEDLALSSRVDNYRRAVSAVEATRAKLGYNIDLELALQAMFYKLQEVL
jgi:DNA polymerase-3 subunit delta'